MTPGHIEMNEYLSRVGYPSAGSVVLAALGRGRTGALSAYVFSQKRVTIRPPTGTTGGGVLAERAAIHSTPVRATPVIDLSQRVCRAGLLALLIAGAACIYVNERSERGYDLAKPSFGGEAADSPEADGRAKKLEHQREVIMRRIAAKAQTV